MLRLVIADDEKSTRDCVIECIDWEQHGMQIVGTASDGLEAKRLIEQERPDIAILDIQMPSISGLDVMEALQGSVRDTAYIIISSFDTFSYVKQAMHLGAVEYLRKKDAGEDVPFHAKWEALIPVLRGELPIHVHAHRSDDMMTAIRIAKEFHLDLRIVHCTDGRLVGKYMAAEHIPGIVGPVCSSGKQENVNVSFETPGAMAKAGVKLCITTDHDVIPLWFLPVCAALAAREGLGQAEALKAITINAAEIAGIADRVGSLEVGKDADLSVFNGYPLNYMSKPQAVFIDGARIC